MKAYLISSMKPTTHLRTSCDASWAKLKILSINSSKRSESECSSTSWICVIASHFCCELAVPSELLLTHSTIYKYYTLLFDYSGSMELEWYKQTLFRAVTVFSSVNKDDVSVETGFLANKLLILISSAFESFIVAIV